MTSGTLTFAGTLISGLSGFRKTTSVGGLSGIALIS